MVYESDFYTTRRPYTRPTVTSYTITRFIDRNDFDSPYSWPVRREFSRILHKPRPHPGIFYTERFLNSRPLTYFDDETKFIRAEAGALMKRVCTPIPKPIRSHYRPYDAYDTMTSCHMLPGNLPQSIINMSYYKEPSSISIGRGHLACIEFAGGRGYPRRKHMFADENRNIRDEIKFRSYYKKALADIQPDPSTLATGFASRIYHLPLKTMTTTPSYKIYKHSRPFTSSMVDKIASEEESKKPRKKEIEKGKDTQEPVKNESEKQKSSEDDGQQEITLNFRKKSPRKISEPVEVYKPQEEKTESEDSMLNMTIKLPRRSTGSIDSTLSDEKQRKKSKDSTKSKDEDEVDMSKDTLVQESIEVTLKTPPSSKNSSRRSSKMDECADHKSPSKSRSKTPDVLLSELGTSDLDAKIDQTPDNLSVSSIEAFKEPEANIIDEQIISEETENKEYLDVEEVVPEKEASEVIIEKGEQEEKNQEKDENTDLAKPEVLDNTPIETNEEIVVNEEPKESVENINELNESKIEVAPEETPITEEIVSVEDIPLTDDNVLTEESNQILNITDSNEKSENEIKTETEEIQKENVLSAEDTDDLDSSELV